MLVLSRKRGERTVIGDDITVTVLEVRGERVKLGFTGPADVPIHREEIYPRGASPARRPWPMPNVPREFHCEVLELIDPATYLGDEFDGIFCKSRKGMYDLNLPLIDLYLSAHPLPLSQRERGD